MKIPSKQGYVSAMLTAGLTTFLLMGVPYGQAMGVTPTEGWTDGRIEGVIERRLEMDSRIHEDKIGVKVENGRTTLYGKVQSLEEKGHAGQVATSVKGVTALVNDLVVPPEVGKDQEIKNSIEQDLRNANLLHQNNVTVRVDQQVVTLDGTVLTRNDKQTVNRLAERTKGVRQVENLLEVVGRQRPDEEIYKDVVLYLTWSPIFHDKDFTVTVNDGVVTLKGTVDLLIQKDVLAMDIGHINGVDEVKIGKVIPSNLLADSANRVK